MPRNRGIQPNIELLFFARSTAGQPLTQPETAVPWRRVGKPPNSNFCQ